MNFLTLVFTVFFLTFSTMTPIANAVIKTQVIDYKEGNTHLEGYLAYDTDGASKKPGVLVVHDWTGLGANMKKRADMLAQLGYVAFAADIYGKGVRPTDPKEAGKIAGSYKNNRSLLRARVIAALNELAKQSRVDQSKIAAIGFCFGGTTVLELARSGADIRGIVTFHGGLDSPHPEDGKNIKAKVLILHGADDPFVPEDQVRAVETELTNAKVDWQLVKYSGAVHSFTIPEAGNDNSKGAAYNEKADKRSWQAMKDFFHEIFAN
jgi:dienelactone hydrolase